MARHAAARAGRPAAEQEPSPSQRLLEAALTGDARQVDEFLAAAGGGESVDVNYVGTVSLRFKCSETVLHEEAPNEVSIGYEEFRTDITPLFAAAHAGHVEIVRRLLSSGAHVNQEVFRGYATSAAAREGHCSILDILLKAGASNRACEDALMEASLYDKAEAVQLLISSEMVKPDAAVNALVTASCRGFIEVVTALIENTVDMNYMGRILLQSMKPILHANVDCTPLAAAIVSRQVSIVKYLLEAGARTDCLVRVGAWSWDPVSGEELRAGSCLGEAYSAAWCAVEYYEATGQILKLVLDHEPQLLESPHIGRTLLCHAILCQNENAVNALLDAGANTKFPIQTKCGFEFRPIHLAARLGYVEILRLLILDDSCIDARTSTGETPLMTSAKNGNADCFLELVSAGADLGLISISGETAVQLAKRSAFASSLVDIFSKVLKNGANLISTDLNAFSPLHFVAESGRCDTLQMILHTSTMDINKLDKSGLTPLMVTAKLGHIEAFRLLVMAGADVAAKTPDGKVLISILQHEVPADLMDSFEQILLNAVLANVITDQTTFDALHYAAMKGNTAAIVQLLKMGYMVNSLDVNIYSPLMLAAMNGHSDACKILLLKGNADCSICNDRNETALTLSRTSSRSNKVTEGMILDCMARSRVLAGEELCKHTREGCGTPHMKVVRMLQSGVLTWGKTEKRNVTCKEAVAGPSSSFIKNRRIEKQDDKIFIFRVVTHIGRVIHFEVESALNLDLWVRGINLISKEATLKNGVTAK